jgi:hypothetical protein
MYWKKRADMRNDRKTDRRKIIHSKNMKILAIILSIVLANQSCTKEHGIEEPNDSFITLSLNFNDQRQEIHSFGASDAWSTQFVGKNWPLEKREQISELLFSMEEDDLGNPRGAGLSGWRFNIGAGSAEQGPASEISDEWRRAECFLNADGSFDWSRHQGQRWFLKEAADYGVADITAFVNSPPVHYTKNGKAWSSGGSSANLRDDSYEDFAVFMATVVEELKLSSGVDIDYISPVNEPQWDWDNKGQEGSPYTNAEIARIAAHLSEQLVQRNLSVQIEISDAAHIAYLYKYGDKPLRGNQAREFFSPEAENYVGELPKLAYKISGHSYYSTYPVTTLLQERTNLANALNLIDANLHYCQTEYCILEGNEEINGNGRDLGIDPALYAARLIHFDLTVAQSSTWYWWLAVSPYDYKDGLVYIDKDKNDGAVYDSKILWALGNYSRFIRPGMHRYQVIRSDNQDDERSATGLMVSGYGPSDKSKAIFVLVNYSKSVTYPVKVKTIDKREAASIKYYTTSAKLEDDLKLSVHGNAGEIISIPSRSLVTVVMEF